eukprot:4823443-Pleurochrysis_carterae.AAC.3
MKSFFAPEKPGAQKIPVSNLGRSRQFARHSPGVVMRFGMSAQELNGTAQRRIYANAKTCKREE